MSANVSFNLRRAHKILALVVGVQFLFWTASGLFFTLFPIEHIRGEHLVRSASEAPLDLSVELVSPTSLAAGIEEAALKPSPFGAVYDVRTGDGYAVFLARTGERLTPWDETDARMLAGAYWKGEGDLVSAHLVETPPREAGSQAPMWRTEFQGTDNAVLWIDPNRLVKPRVRTTNWRIFDVLWRFHIMDITGADRFDSWWLKLFAFLGFTTVLFGLALLIDRARRGRLLK